MWYGRLRVDQSMKRPRTILPLLVPLALSAALAAGWVRSYRRYDAVGFWPSGRHDRPFGVLSDSGTLCLATSVEARPSSPRRRWDHFEAAPGRIALSPDVAGFVLRANSQGFIIGLTYWAACVLATLPAASIWRTNRRRRRLKRAGHCPRCGYDLRATPDRCPECGHAGARVAGKISA
jgi:hypothetical protein